MEILYFQKKFELKLQPKNFSNIFLRDMYMPSNYKKSLKNLANENSSERIKALRELGQTKASECTSDIVHLIEKEEVEDVKVEAIMALGKIGDISAGDTLLSLLENPDIPIVMESASVMGSFCAKGFTKAIEPLENLLDHGNFRVRKFTIEALGVAGSQTSIAKLLNHFKKEETSIETKQLIATSIGRIGGSHSIEVLTQLLNPSEDIHESTMEVRRATLFALGEIKNSTTLEILGNVYNDKKEQKIIRKYAEEAIRKTIIGAKNEFVQIRKRAEDILKGKA
jgi:HEAT repeat protein